jgi:acetyl esterase/lipase
VGACDGLRDDGIAYALRLRNSGVDAQLEVVPGVPHGINVSPATNAAIQWYRDQVRALYVALWTTF